MRAIQGEGAELTRLWEHACESDRMGCQVFQNLRSKEKSLQYFLTYFMIK